MKLTITITSGSGGSVSDEIDHTDQILYDLGLDDQDIKNLCDGAAVAIPVKTIPDQFGMEFAGYVKQLATDINRVYASGMAHSHYSRADQKREEAALEAADLHDERHEAHR